MTLRIDASRLLLLLAGTGMGLASPAQAHPHKEHSIYGSVSGYRAIMDRNSDAYHAADAFCQTNASVNAATSGTTTVTSGGGGGGGSGNQFKRLKTQYAVCMESQGAWIRITGNAAGDRPDND